VGRARIVQAVPDALARMHQKPRGQATPRSETRPIIDDQAQGVDGQRRESMTRRKASMGQRKEAEQELGRVRS